MGQMIKDVKYQSGTFPSVFRVTMVSFRAARFFDITARDLLNIYGESNLDSRTLIALKESFKSLYELTGMETDTEKGDKKSEEGTDMSEEKGFDFKSYWFENRIRKIRSCFWVEEPPYDLWSYFQDEDKIFLENPFLAVIYDYNKLNNRGQTIMQLGGLTNVTYYGTLAIDPRKLSDINAKFMATKDLITVLSYHTGLGVSFIFWAMLVLTVDNTDFEKHLSEICDIAEIIGMQEDTILDIMDVIKVIYRKDESVNISLRTKTAKQTLSGILRMFGVYDQEVL